LERKLKKNDGSKEKSDSHVEARRTNTSSGLKPDEKPARRIRSPSRGVRKAKSGDIDLLATAAKVVPKVRRAKSVEPRAENHGGNTRGRKSPAASGNSPLAKLPDKLGTDDLDQLYRHAVQQVEGDTTLLASTYHMQDTIGDSAFEMIFSDTEETYGIEIPTEIVRALKDTILETVVSPSDVSFIGIMRSLHREHIILEAERRVGREIPSDLIAAIRSTSLPPGVSVETLRPLDGSSSVLASKYNSSAGSSALSLALTESSRRSYTNSSRSAFLKGSTSNLGVSLGIQTATVDIATQHGASMSSIFSMGDPLEGIPESNASKNELDGGSSHSTNSWGVLSLSKSPAVTKRKRKNATKKYKKGTKDAMFERAQKRKEKVANFMNSLSDFGNETDDLKDIFNQAKETLEACSPLIQNSRKQPRDTQQTKGKRKPSNEKLQAVMEGEGSTGSIFSMRDASEPIASATSIPDGSGSCVTTSPQEAELDMLLSRFAEIAGRPVPHEIETALRKASRSMDESLDMAAPLDGPISRSSVVENCTTANQKEPTPKLALESSNFLRSNLYSTGQQTNRAALSSLKPDEIKEQALSLTMIKPLVSNAKQLRHGMVVETLSKLRDFKSKRMREYVGRTDCLVVPSLPFSNSNIESLLLKTINHYLF
jgi:hypothetical protein